MNRTATIRRACGLALLTVPWLTGCRKQQQPTPPGQEAVMPSPRTLSPDEQTELTRALRERFREAPPSGAQFGAAGVFRVVATDRFQYMERTDVGSVVFERADYAAPGTVVDSGAAARTALLARIDTSLGAIGLDATGRRFLTFQDEFAGGAPRGLSVPIDPRRASKLVGRTAEFARMVEDVPVFGSELVIGLMPDGRVGRLRLHWPRIDAALVAEARRLQEAVRRQAWKVPDELRSGDTKILDVTAGVGHSGIADPGFRAAAVVRVTFRRASADSTLPLVTTGYKYFDARGREVVLTVFPKVAGTPTSSKPPVGKP